MEIPNPAEESIVRKFTRPIWHRFLRGIKDYQLVQEGDRIAVCISGGKDSMMMASVCSACSDTANSPLRWSFSA